jgi:hypothetical protein
VPSFGLALDLHFRLALGKLKIYEKIRLDLYWSGPDGPGVRD